MGDVNFRDLVADERTVASEMRDKLSDYCSLAVAAFNASAHARALCSQGPVGNIPLAERVLPSFWIFGGRDRDRTCDPLGVSPTRPTEGVRKARKSAKFQ